MADIKDIIPNGSTVTTKIGKLEAIVIGVCARGEKNENIEYHIAHFLNGEYKNSWVQSYEVELKVDNSEPMGFQRKKEQPLLTK